MGVFGGLLNFRRTARGKFVTWAGVGLGVLFIVIGIILTSVSPKTVTATSIELTAPGMTQDAETGIYYLEVNKPSTSISIQALPANATTPAYFSTTTPEFISITAKTPSSGTALLTLNRVASPGFANGFYEFHKDTDVPGKIRVDVLCGRRTATIYVKVVLNPEDVVVTTTLERFIPGVSNAWAPVDTLDMDDFYSMGAILNPALANYRINAKMYIYDELVYDNVSNIDKFTYYDYRESLGGCGFELYNTNGYISIPPITASGNYYFKVGATFDGKTYYTASDFKIIISPITEL